LSAAHHPFRPPFWLEERLKQSSPFPARPPRTARTNSSDSQIPPQTKGSSSRTTTTKKEKTKWKELSPIPTHFPPNIPSLAQPFRNKCSSILLFERQLPIAISRRSFDRSFALRRRRREKKESLRESSAPERGTNDEREGRKKTAEKEFLEKEGRPTGERASERAERRKEGSGRNHACQSRRWIDVGARPALLPPSLPREKRLERRGESKPRLASPPRARVSGKEGLLPSSVRQSASLHTLAAAVASASAPALA